MYISVQLQFHVFQSLRHVSTGISMYISYTLFLELLHTPDDQTLVAVQSLHLATAWLMIFKPLVLFLKCSSSERKGHHAYEYGCSLQLCTWWNFHVWALFLLLSRNLKGPLKFVDGFLSHFTGTCWRCGMDKVLMW